MKPSPTRPLLSRHSNVATHYLTHTLAIRLAKREYLKPTRVGEDWAAPIHKLVQATHIAHYVAAWLKVKMIGVCQDGLGTQVLNLLRGNCLNRRLGTDSYKGRCLNSTVRRNNFAGTC